MMGRYACDPHQQWADIGLGDDPEPSTCGDCGYFEPSPYPGDDGGVCVLATEVTRDRVNIEWRLMGDDACGEFR